MNIELNSNNLPLNSILSINSSATSMACLELKQLLHARVANTLIQPVWPFCAHMAPLITAPFGFLVCPSGNLFPAHMASLSQPLWLLFTSPYGLSLLAHMASTAMLVRRHEAVLDLLLDSVLSFVEVCHTLRRSDHKCCN